MRQKNKPISELASLLRLYPQVLRNVPVAEKKDFAQVPSIMAAVENAEKALGERGRVLLRYSGTEPLVRVMVEGEDEEQVKRLAESIAETVKTTLR
jgi:phosphoglucosamine mutase